MFKRFLSSVLIALIVLFPLTASAGSKWRGDVIADESITLPEQGSAPSAPAAGSYKLWMGADGLHYLNSSGTETTVTKKNNLVATTDPTVNEDANDGYSPGSRWINTTLDKEFVCLDATVGAAVWTETTGAGGGGGSGDVVGPASSTDETLVRYDSTTGKLLQNSGVTLSDADDIGGVNNISAGGYFQVGEIASPANPPANNLRLYMDSTDETFRTRSSSGEIKILSPPSINVKEHGATGDGTTNDTAAIQAAIDKAEAQAVNARQKIAFPCGSYKVDLDSLAINASAMRLVGECGISSREGPPYNGVTIFSSDTGGGTLLDITPVALTHEGVQIEHINFLSTAGDHLANGIDLANMNRGYIRDCGFRGFAKGINNLSSDDVAWYDYDHNMFDDNTIGIFFQTDVGGIGASTISGGEFSADSGQTAIECQAGCSQLKIDHIQVSGAGKGVVISGGNVSVSFSTFELSNPGIEVVGTASNNEGDFIEIMGNGFTGSGSETGISLNSLAVSNNLLGNTFSNLGTNVDDSGNNVRLDAEGFWAKTFNFTFDVSTPLFTSGIQIQSTIAFVDLDDSDGTYFRLRSQGDEFNVRNEDTGTNVLTVSDTGNLDVTGTVEGRTMADDGAKLDKTPMPNGFLNADFNIWQEATSFTISSGVGFITADLMRGDRGTGATLVVSRQEFTVGQTDVPDNPQYYMRYDRTVAGSANSAWGQRIEDVRTYAGKTVTASYWVRCEAAFTLEAQTTQIFGTGGSADVSTTAQDLDCTTSWARYDFTFSIASISGKTVTADSAIAFQLVWPETEGATNYFDIAHIQVVEGSEPQTFFEKKTFSQELRECQRYRYKSFPFATAVGQSAGVGGAIRYAVNLAGVHSHFIRINFPVAMYVPNGGMTVNFYNPAAANGDWYNASPPTAGSSGTPTANDVSEFGFNLENPQHADDLVGDLALVHFYISSSIGP